MSLYPINSPAVEAVPPTVSFQDGTGNGTSLTTYTFSSMTVGSTTDPHKCVIGVGAGDGNTGKTVSSITVGGVSATVIVSHRLNFDPANIVEMWQVEGITATSGDVVVTWSGGMNRCTCIVYEVLNAASAVTASGADSTGSSTKSVSLSIPANGVAIGISGNFTGAQTTTWTNLTEDYDPAASYYYAGHSSASKAVTASETPTITSLWTNANGDGMIVASWAGA
jgi:hypothetical protein